MSDIAVMIAPLPAKGGLYGIQQRGQNIQEKETTGNLPVEASRSSLSRVRGALWRSLSAAIRFFPTSNFTCSPEIPWMWGSARRLRPHQMPRLPSWIYFSIQLQRTLVPGVSFLAYLPSCHNKKVVQFGHHLKETVLYPVPHRQYVFSVPKILRRFFFYDRKLLGRLSQCAVKSLTKFFQLILGKKTGIPGVVVAIQTSTAKSTLLETMPDGIPISMPWWPTVFSWRAAIFLSCRRQISGHWPSYSELMCSRCWKRKGW